MDRHVLLKKLNWFYSLEVNQVDLYNNQSREAKDPHLARVLKKFSEIEQTHVENIQNLIESLGSTPTVIGKVVAEITGEIAGKLSSVPSTATTLKMNIALENKAMSDYKALISEVDDGPVKEVLWNNLIDEELHTAWMMEKEASERHFL